MNIWDIVILLAVGVAAALALRHTWRRHTGKSSSACCGCSGAACNCCSSKEKAG
ncbi:MAG: hypothetical protein IJ573_09650 [Clostridia bacterium]|nr:hypothetical protein [Clostridia bacterium]